MYTWYLYAYAIYCTPSNAFYAVTVDRASLMTDTFSAAVLPMMASQLYKFLHIIDDEGSCCKVAGSAGASHRRLRRAHPDSHG